MIFVYICEDESGYGLYRFYKEDKGESFNEEYMGAEITWTKVHQHDFKDGEYFEGETTKDKQIEWHTL